jgi:hypothetical protein
MYVIKNTEHGGYVNQPGSRSSYTRSLEQARKFDTKDQAEGERCPENEVVIDVNDLLRR